METKNYYRQFRYIDPDKSVAEGNEALDKNGKVKFNWDMTEIDQATKDNEDITPLEEFIVSCKASNAVKAVEFDSVDLPTTTEEADEMFLAMSDSDRLGMVRYAEENNAKDATSAGLMERHESPEKAQKRLEKNLAKAAEAGMDWFKQRIKENRYPAQDEFNQKLREIHEELGLPAPETSD